MSRKEKVAPDHLPAHLGVAYNALDLVQQMGEAAQHDQLTGLFNKEATEHKIEERIKQDKLFILGYMDMDNFKEVNDTLGHGTGNRLLAQFGAHMRKYFRRESDVLGRRTPTNEDVDNGVLGRVGGDEFCQVIDLGATPNPTERRSAKEHEKKAVNYATSVLEDFVSQQPPEVQACGFTHISVGFIVREPGDERSADELLHDVDTLMYANKPQRERARA
jgi:GGDEF domain-containing protein